MKCSKNVSYGSMERLPMYVENFKAVLSNFVDSHCSGRLLALKFMGLKSTVY